MPIKSRTILAIDPGSKSSGILLYRHDKKQPVIGKCCELSNEDVLKYIQQSDCKWIACEDITPRGQVFGHDVNKTAQWVGRFHQQALSLGKGFAKLERNGTICRHILGSYHGNDSLIRAALIRRFGKDETKHVTGHCWSALAVGTTFYDLCRETILS